MKEENKEEELFIPKTKYKGLKICLATLLVLGLMAGGYFLYQYKFNNPKIIIEDLLTDAESNIKEAFKETTSSNNNKYKIDGHIKIDSNIDDETLKILKDIELQLTGEIDTKESIGNCEINTKYKNDKLINIKTYYEKNVVYLLLDGLYDKYLKIDENAEANQLPVSDIPSININPNDLEIISKALTKALKEEISKYEIKQTDATITINGKDVNVLNNYIELKDNEVNKLAQSIINNLKNNKEFAEIIKKLTQNEASDIFSTIEKSISEEEFKGVYKINFYTDKGLFKKKLISVRQNISQNNSNVSLNVDKLDDDEIMISITTMGITYSIKVKKNNSAINFDVNMNIMGQYIDIEFNMNYETINEVTKFDVSNNKNINELTEKESEEINKKLMDNKALLKLIEEINKIGKTEA